MILVLHVLCSAKDLWDNESMMYSDLSNDAQVYEIQQLLEGIAK